eukprot:CAMPEP_0169087716 /NCGR_PEP_ID=MMETSP1015-20121227/14376_1 /TAXON_ID=342587 /ORGANISM="Karlodinium micrum, Strain CCMP2283" /LENGTH=53 /DNA_ID=CAMNT_0009147957 /DNA_START=1291 /DNA_END=1449 /DNA_ORIENTATION=+
MTSHVFCHEATDMKPAFSLPLFDRFLAALSDYSSTRHAKRIKPTNQPTNQPTN